MENLRLTLIQTDLTWEEPEVNLAHFENLIDNIKEETDLILLPEMFTTGFSMQPQPLAEDNDGRTLTWLKKQAQKKNAAISGSVIIREKDKYVNRLFFVLPDGNYHTYDKRHLFSFAGEHNNYAQGTQKLIVEYKGWRICPLICYDLRFPVWARNTENYDLLFYIANWPQRRIMHWDTLLKARSIENICYVAGLNRTGSDPNNNIYNGHSTVYKPMGEPLPCPDWEKEFTHTFTLEKSFLEETRKKFRFLEDRDEFGVTL